VKVEIWSDIVCPWCFVGKRQFERAVAEFEHGDQVEVVWRSYELDPRAPAEREGTYAERIARKYGLEVGAARAAISRIINAGSEAGIDFKFEQMRPGNTFDAHRLVHLAKVRGIQNQVKERFLEANFFEGEPIGRRDALERLAAEAGLDAAEVAAVLDSDQYAEEVRVDERVAQSIGITGVPFFLIDDAYGIPGAQEPQVFLNVLRRAWGDTHRDVEIVAAQGEVCDDDEVCEI
jgi:predicted DsbA family dithiol-disulfide isomerase